MDNLHKNVVLITSKELIKECDRIPVILKRASMVNDLIKSYQLHNRLLIKAPSQCSDSDLKLFHSQTYVDYLKNHNEKNDLINEDDINDIDLENGFGYDCSPIDRIYDFCKTIAGGTLTAVDEILNGTKIAINWNGGWHHAQRDEAEGFCYINDIVIGIQRLKSKYNRILYIDLDVHHGDGVENAFSTTKRVLTLSFHQHDRGFFPGTGNVNECGFGPGLGYSVNFPFKHNMTGYNYIKYFRKVTNLIRMKYNPNAIVVQCGGDIIVGDSIGNCNLTPYDMGICVQQILSWNLPAIFLGGGGYHLINTAKYWTYLTSIITNTEIPVDIPDEDNVYFLDYGPSYELTIESKNVPDPNTVEELEANYQIIVENFKRFNVHEV